MEYSKEDLQTATKVGFQTKPGKSALPSICGNSTYSNISSTELQFKLYEW